MRLLAARDTSQGYFSGYNGNQPEGNQRIIAASDAENALRRFGNRRFSVPAERYAPDPMKGCEEKVPAKIFGSDEISQRVTVSRDRVTAMQ